MPKIAIASCGLGHVARGIETWARDTATALVLASEQNVTLFCGAEIAMPDCSKSADGLQVVVLPCARRSASAARTWAARMPGCAWRWGLNSAYGLEQWTFWWRLWPILRRERFEVLHVQDPMLAYWCRSFRRLGLLHTREILAHGTEERVDFLASFDYLQQLTPWHLEQLLAATSRRSAGWTAIPNFVDTTVFRPPRRGEVEATRTVLGIDPSATVFGCVAAVKKEHKRIDFLIREFASCLDEPAAGRVHLLLVGAREEDSEELVALAQSVAGDRISVLLDRRRDEMPALFRACDEFVLASLFEMMPISVLEAMASGLPIIAHAHPVLAWMIGDGGTTLDMREPGSLANALPRFVQPEWRATRGAAARARAVETFSVESVIGQYVDYYHRVSMNDGRGSAHSVTVSCS